MIVSTNKIDYRISVPLFSSQWRGNQQIFTTLRYKQQCKLKVGYSICIKANKSQKQDARIVR